MPGRWWLWRVPAMRRGFRRRSCEGGRVTAAGVLCGKAEFLAASTAINRGMRHSQWSDRFWRF